MRDKLKSYIDLLFAGAADAEEIKQEILQNTLDRYDDLISQGKSPEAAYRLAISGIGDINEILGAPSNVKTPSPAAEPTQSDPDTRRKRAIAIAMYIACPIPLFVLGDLGYGSLGLCLLLLLVAAATALLISCGKEEVKETEKKADPSEFSPHAQLRSSISGAIRTGALVAFLVISFITGAWYITWLIFPISAAIRGIVIAIMDLKEAK